jgi:hypothetical protein
LISITTQGVRGVDRDEVGPTCRARMDLSPDNSQPACNESGNALDPRLEVRLKIDDVTRDRDREAVFDLPGRDPHARDGTTSAGARSEAADEQSRWRLQARTD